MRQLNAQNVEEMAGMQTMYQNTILTLMTQTVQSMDALYRYNVKIARAQEL